ncbi:MAG: hypothetical protein AAF671_12725, partial [Pseudomonadota bacterium]
MTEKPRPGFSNGSLASAAEHEYHVSRRSSLRRRWIALPQPQSLERAGTLIFLMTGGVSAGSRTGCMNDNWRMLS